MLCSAQVLCGRRERRPTAADGAGAGFAKASQPTSVRVRLDGAEKQAASEGGDVDQPVEAAGISTIVCDGAASVRTIAGLVTAVRGNDSYMPCEIHLASATYELEQALNISRPVVLAAETEGEAVLRAGGSGF